MLIHQEKLAHQRLEISIIIEKYLLKTQISKNIKHSRRRLGKGAAFLVKGIYENVLKESDQYRKYIIAQRDLWRIHESETEY